MDSKMTLTISFTGDTMNVMCMKETPEKKSYFRFEVGSILQAETPGQFVEAMKQVTRSSIVEALVNMVDNLAGLCDIQVIKKTMPPPENDKF